ncbi:MAG TPA: FAD-dependent oxidoreductase [Tepidisphaeraceae bacterium]|nr:FAD-dependent oxidoreductase [Tepidisphaeraceae bacterium]
MDVLIYGGGIAGVWILDELRRGGINAVLVEKTALGQGQTVASQGIIHGGLKYMFDGNVTAPVKAIAEMPVIWKECLRGEREPDLSGVKVQSECCWLWGTGSIKSRIFMAGSTIALRAAPQAVEREQWPGVLKEVRGKVMRVGEQVVDTVSLMGKFLERNRGRIFTGDVEVRANTIILAAGEGNAELRKRFGLSENFMQRRPLHMVMARGSLPELFGHCVGGAKPRITVTSARDSGGRMVWQIGGQIAEDGVKMSVGELVKHAAKEIEECVPGVDLGGVEISTYRIDRAEAATGTGQRPDDVHVLSEGNVITVFPTKLALAPRLAERVIKEINVQRSTSNVQLPKEWEEPQVARPPWEREGQWFSAR